MKRSDAKKNIEVIKAFAEGKTIQYFDTPEWVDTKEPTFVDYLNYRIKPEPKLVPFTFEDAKELVGKKIFAQSAVGMITYAQQSSVFTGAATVGYNLLLKIYKFEDGSPCGKIVES